MQLSTKHLAALERSITPTRMATYLSAAEGDRERARALYLWDRDLSAAFLADLAILEVALRNAMCAQLEARWGIEWFKNLDMPLDDRSLKELNIAWGRVKEPKTPGKLVAQCMFGFWRGLLDKGDHTGKEPRRVRCDYEVLWRGVLNKAFPGGRNHAKQNDSRWNREYALAVVTRVKEVRNRVAHLEPMINGLPLPGQQVRLSPQQAQQDVMGLAAMLDRDLHDFLAVRSQILEVLSKKPERG